MKIANQVEELVRAGVISAKTADAIEHYYLQKKNNERNTNRLMVAFGILGATLVGLGIILIIAHNWDTLSRTVKTIFAFLPLVIGQTLGVYVLFRQFNSSAWREGVSVFTFFAVAASISMVSQIYNIPGDMAGFLLTWMLLSFPLYYLLRSSLTALLYLIGITAYGVAEGYFNSAPAPLWTYWVMLFAILPYYFNLLRYHAESNFTSFFNWLLPASLLICLGLFTYKTEELMLLAYLLMLAAFYLIGNYRIFNSMQPFSNGYRIIGLLGSLGIFLFLSFDEFWLAWYDLRTENLLAKPELWLVFFFLVFCLALLKFQQWKFSPVNWMFLFIMIIFLTGLSSEILPLLLVNLFYLFTGIWFIREGARQDHLGILNFGLLVIASLVVARFFDANLSFVVRGLLFLLVGIGFFVANHRMLKKRKTQIT